MDVKGNSSLFLEVSIRFKSMFSLPDFKLFGWEHIVKCSKVGIGIVLDSRLFLGGV